MLGAEEGYGNLLRRIAAVRVARNRRRKAVVCGSAQPTGHRRGPTTVLTHIWLRIWIKCESVLRGLVLPPHRKTSSCCIIHYITLQCSTLHYSTLHYITLHTYNHAPVRVECDFPSALLRDYMSTGGKPTSGKHLLTAAVAPSVGRGRQLPETCTCRCARLAAPEPGRIMHAIFATSSAARLPPTPPRAPAHQK